MIPTMLTWCRSRPSIVKPCSPFACSFAFFSCLIVTGMSDALSLPPRACRMNGGRVNAGLKKGSARWAVLGHVGLLEEGIFTCVTHLSVGTTVIDLEASALAVLERGTAKALPHHKRTNREGHSLYLHGAAARKHCRGDGGWGWGVQVPWEC